MSQSVHALASELHKPQAFPLFVTGAGISTASGIPTFRGPEPDAVWTRDVTEMGTLAFFRNQPVEQWLWYLERFDKFRSARENAAHVAIANIERHVLNQGSRFQVITQNIDGLHAKAGTQNLIEIHGSAHRMRCSRNGCVQGAPNGTLPWSDLVFQAFRNDPSYETLARCSDCDALLRPHVLWFDEFYDDHNDYRMSDARRAVEDASLVVFVGTSFSVGITAMILDAVHLRRVPCWAIDPYIKVPPIQTMHVVREPAESFLPMVTARLM